MIAVKVCGITRPDDARLAASLGAAAVGLVFWPGSPRCVTPARAAGIVAALPGDVLAVGVFVNQDPRDVATVLRDVRLGAIQLHGDERIGDYLGQGLPVLKAVHVGEGFDPRDAMALPAGVTVLLDACDPVRRGGTGRTIDWDAAATVARQRRTILAGGLHAGNVREAIARVRPAMIDVSSGVEAEPGVKHHERLRAFFEAIG